MNGLSSLWPRFFTFRLLIWGVGGLFVSCEKVIDVDLNTADPQTVVDAVFAAQDTVHTVFVSTSGSYTDGNGLGPIEGAVVSVTDQNGQVVQFNETIEGIYQAGNFYLNTLMTYTISVTTNSETIEGSSTLVLPTPIDSIYFEKEEGGGPGGGGGGGGPGGGPPGNTEPGFDVHVMYTDEPGVENFHLIRLSVNGEQRDRYTVANDDLNDGHAVDLRIFRENVVEDDTVMVELWSMDRAGYDYYNTLADIESSNPFTSSTPYNPITNLSSHLGHFTVYQRHRSTRIVGN